jgi:GNAT superfamily N-acetyltransferase
MQFELSGALINDILFSMEDQDGEFLIDTRQGVVVGKKDFTKSKIPEEENGEVRFIPLPEWDSSSGYRMMEHFAAGFKNPLIREELSEALNRGKRVFRAFKNILALHPEAEKLWFAFKDREMKREILRWYNGLREEWGLEKIGLEPEETGDLILEDFRFRGPQRKDAAAAAALHRLCLEERRKKEEEKNPEEGKTFFPEEGDVLDFPGDLALAVETGTGDFAGYISARRKEKSLCIINLEVKPEYRGLGIGETLLSRLLDHIDPEVISAVFIDLPTEAEGFSQVLCRESFRPCVTRYGMNPLRRLSNENA